MSKMQPISQTYTTDKVTISPVSRARFVKIAFILVASREREILKLTIELVPSAVWESSLYRLMTKEVWNSTSIAVFHLWLSSPLNWFLRFILVFIVI